MSIVVRLIDRLWAAAEVGRWRLSKALGVPGLERIAWRCIGAGAIAVAAAAQVVLEVVWWASAPAEVSPQLAVINIWVYLAIMVVSALIAYAMRPKPPTISAQTPESPVVEDGLGIREIFGTRWIRDPIQLLWRSLEPVPITKKGGKK